MNPAVLNVEASLIRAIHSRKKATSIDLGLGQPTLPPAIAHFEFATRWTAENGCGYASNIGDPDLREAIARHYAYPALDRAANVIVTMGSQEAVYVAMTTLLDPAHDEVIITDPAFMVYSKIARMNGVRVKHLQLDPREGFAFDADRILGAVGPRTRLIVICSPSNPTGRAVSKQAVAEISAALLDRPGAPVYVLHDEIYRELVYSDDIGSFAQHYPYTIAINSLSKSNAMPGLRLGWLIAPADVVPEIVKLHGWVCSCASTYAQRVAFSIFETNDLAAHRSWYVQQKNEVVALASELRVPYVEPEGAFYLCLDLGVPNSIAFANALVDDEDVLVIPGSAFGPSMEGWIRTSFVAPFDRYREGLERVVRYAGRYESQTGTLTKQR